MTRLVDLIPAHFAIVECILAEHALECEVQVSDRARSGMPVTPPISL